MYHTAERICIAKWRFGDIYEAKTGSAMESEGLLVAPP